MNLGELTIRNVKLRPSAPAIIFEERAITHAEFGARVFCLANAIENGTQPD
jgi:hypothetical protein